MNDVASAKEKLVCKNTLSARKYEYQNQNYVSTFDESFS